MSKFSPKKLITVLIIFKKSTMKNLFKENLGTIISLIVILFLCFYPTFKNINFDNSEVGRYLIYPNSSHQMIDTKTGTVYITRTVNNKNIWVVYGTLSNLTLEEAIKKNDSLKLSFDTSSAL